MRVVVRHFGPLRDLRGTDREEVEVPAGTTARALLERLAGDSDLPPLLYVLDEAWAGPDAVLSEGCEVAFLPPVGGG